MPKNISSDKLSCLTSYSSLEIKEKLKKVGSLETSILFCGETGTGKDFWADYLSSLSGKEPYVNLNCGDVTPTLLESEWFGYTRGAFTGAEKDYDGRWKSAAGGILFINQVDLLDLNLQSRLLRVIERKKYYPVGSLKEESVDARFIFSSSENIEEMVEEESFRRDLYYRISVYRIDIPPLRDRAEEIPQFVNYFANQSGINLKLSQKGFKLLESYSWPGNIRELENFIQSSSIVKGSLEDSDVLGFLENRKGFFKSFYKREPELKELNREYAEYMVNRYKNRRVVAEKMGISRKTLYNILQKR